MGQFEIWVKQIREDQSVPESVQAKMDAALAGLSEGMQHREQDGEDAMNQKMITDRRTIRERSAEADGRTGNAKKDKGVKKTHGGARNSKFAEMAAAAAICVLAGGITVAAAAYLRWTGGIESRFHVRENQKQNVSESGLAVNPAVFAQEGDVVSDTADGVTVWIEQTLVDQNTAALAFKMKGMDFPKGESPGFERITILIDGERAGNWEAGFYNGLTDEGVYSDGTPFEYWEKPDGRRGIVTRYQDAEGNYEYDVNLRNEGQFDTYVGKKIEVCFQNPGYSVWGTEEPADQAGRDGVWESSYEYVTVMEGEWHLSWTLSGSMEKRHETVHRPIGDTGVTLLEAEISPVSLRVQCQTDHLWDTGIEMDENGFPELVGVKLQDGTVYLGICTTGTEGYRDTEALLYEMDFGIDRVIDPKEVEALLFLKDLSDANREPMVEDCYVIPIP
ncbi:MAG: DUF4179 domain-containing protein [Lachnospiraceae bacterium]|nr:DUF4179 domain-containing protein [Lachnospiraceae bacterium]